MFDTSYFDQTFFPEFENNIYEFKQSYQIQNFETYLKTLCAFLNSGGGYLIFGITDERLNKGMKQTDKTMDKIILNFDSIYHRKLIVSIKNDIRAHILPDVIKCHIVKNKKNNFFLVIQSTPTLDHKYCLKKGEQYYRLNASNILISISNKMYTEYDMQEKIRSEQNKINTLLSNNVKIYTSHIEESKNEIRQSKNEIEQLRESIVLYQKKVNMLEKDIYNSNNVIEHLIPDPPSKLDIWKTVKSHFYWLIY